jgi:hypothetical protein
MRKIFFLIGFLALIGLAALPASAGVVYNNDFGGVISGDNYDVDAWTINFGFQVANSFSLASGTTVTGVNLALWAQPSDSLTSVDWYIRADDSPSNPLLGTLVASGIANPVGTTLESNGFGYNILEESFDISQALSGGTTYWLQLDTAVVPNGDPIYWDQSDGPSTMYENSFGYFTTSNENNTCKGLCTGSDSFQLLANTGTATPEPSAWLLLGGGLMALAGFRRRKA